MSLYRITHSHARHHPNRRCCLDWIARTSLAALTALLVLAALGPRQAVAQQPQIRIVMSEWRPYTSELLPGKGALAEMVEIAFRLQGVEAIFSVVPWPDAVNMIHDGEADALLPVYLSEKNKEHYYLSEPLLAVDSVFVRLSSHHVTYNTLQDLIRCHIGTVKDSFYAATLAKQGVFLVEESLNEFENYKKLVAGRIDIMLDTRETIERLVKMIALQERVDIVYMEPPYHTKTLHIAFGPNRRGEMWRDVFNAGLKQVREKDVHAAILEKHHIVHSSGISNRQLD